MNVLARLVDFYRAQIDLIWNWRRGRRQLLIRAAVSFVVAFLSLAATAALLPGLRIDSAWALAAAVIVIGLLSALVRPLLLALVAPLSLILMLLTALVFQVVAILAVGPIVPGFHVGNLLDATFAAVTFAVINSAISWLFSLDSDDSYYSMLVRRLLSRRKDANHTNQPGLIVVQLDGLAHSVLQQQINAGRVPTMSRWLRDQTMRLSPWVALLPSQTSASQAGIMFGNNDDIPAFRWFDKENNKLFVSNRALDAQALEQSLEERAPGLLKNDGASIANLVNGGAVRSYLTMSTMHDPGKGLGQSRSYFAFFLSPYGFVHAIVLGIAEVAKELFQARRARVQGIEPRLDRGFPYPFLRSLTNVVLRPITTSLVIEEMLRGTSIIYVTYTDYDEIAHHSGPQRAETLDALDGIDRVLNSIAKAEEDAPRPYNLVVLSDHGQTLGATFKQRYGRSLDDLIEQLMGGADEINAAVNDLDEWHVVNAFAAEMTRARGAAGATRRALMTKTGRKVTAQGTAYVPATESGDGLPDLVVCPSGNLALVYFPEIKGRADLESLNERYPGMVDALANHPGVGLVLVRSGEHGALVIGPEGVHRLGDDKVDKQDPLEKYGPYAAAALKRLDGMGNVGDLVLVSMFEPELEQVAAFEELIGSHGGLGGPQTEPMILYPHDWQLDAEPLVGAPAVYAQLQTWLGQHVTAPITDSTEQSHSDRPTTCRRRRRARTTAKAPVATA